MAIKTPILDQLRSRAIIPACGLLALDGATPRNLLLGTAAQESGGAYIAQFPSGPALSYWEIEEATAIDVLARVKQRSPWRWVTMQRLLIPALDPIKQIATNMVYAAALCRLKYWLVEEALPAAHDVPALGAYWKQYYNTEYGAGTVAEFVDNFERRIGAPPDIDGELSA
jgi:hypothetical protein